MLNQPANNPAGGTFEKIDAIKDAYSQLRISGLTVIPTPEDLELALERLECMAAEWAERNICSNYNFEDEPDPNTPTNIKRGFKQAFATNLAVRMIPDFNKAVPQVLMAQANQSLSNLSARSAASRISGVPYPSRQPVGSGNSLRYNRWQRFYRNGGEAPNSCNVNELYIGDINDYTEHFDAYLGENEIISNVSFSIDSGILLKSSSFTDNDVQYQIEASSASVSGSTQQLVIIMTTDLGRVTTRVIYFSLAARPRAS